MKIQKIYDEYKTMPQLQLHMLRVAGVAKIICDNFQKEIEKESVITAALLHDMGNIIKFNLNRFPEYLEPKGLKYWEEVKGDYIKKYGQDEHLASEKIAQEIGVSEIVQEIIKAYGFKNAQKTLNYTGFERKITPYSDMRVGVNGIQSMDTRIDAGVKRYSKGRKKGLNKITLLDLKNTWRKIEKQIFSHTKISPKNITDKGVAHLLPKLREFEINLT
jgi:hypothetical protein